MYDVGNLQCPQCFALMSCWLTAWLVSRCVIKPRLHDTTCCQTGCQCGCRLTTGCIVYTNIQPVVKAVWQPAVSTGCIMYTAGCQTGCITGCTTQFDNRLNKQWLFIQSGLTTGLTTGWMFVYTIQPVFKLVVQPVVSCKRGIRMALVCTERRRHVGPACRLLSQLILHVPRRYTPNSFCTNHVSRSFIIVDFCLLFRPHCGTTYVDAVYSYRLSSMVCQSVCHTSEPC